MPDRIIKESICTSETIDKLTWLEEVFFQRLTVNCDDYGRFDARPAILKSRLFPLKGNLTEKTICEALDKLASVGLITTYICDGKSYLQIITWDKHQRIRAKRSKFPEPADICCQVPSSAVKCCRNPIQSESESESESESNPTLLFDVFWNAYPQKKGKQAALKAWNKIKPNAELVDRMLLAISEQKQSKQWLKDGGQFIPYPSTWLNQARWEDETEVNLSDDDDFKL